MNRRDGILAYILVVCTFWLVGRFVPRRTSAGPGRLSGATNQASWNSR